MRQRIHTPLNAYIRHRDESRENMFRCVYVAVTLLLSKIHVSMKMHYDMSRKCQEKKRSYARFRARALRKRTRINTGSEAADAASQRQRFG